jgi:hypothetical protein
MRSEARLIVAGTLLCGTVDIADALVFSWLRRRTPPEIVLQFIASGLEGKAAFAQGWAGAALGLAVHYAISFCWVALFVVIVKAAPRLLRWAWVFGAAYGLAMYAVMNFVVLPLTHIGRRALPHGASLINGVAALVVFGLLMVMLWRREAER